MRIKTILSSAIVCLIAFSYVQTAYAAPANLTFTHEHHIFTLAPAKYPSWRSKSTQWYFRGQRAAPPARFLSCGKEPIHEPGWEARSTIDWNADAIALSIAEEIASRLDRDAGKVRIGRSLSGAIVFDGRGLPGRKVNLRLAAELTKQALEQDVASIVLPVDISPPEINVEDPELQRLGISEVVTVGESVFTGSPVNRRHNIRTGIDKFNGHLIPQGSVFSFNETLGPVNATTGYRKELVIQGQETIPDYGGGLCQVSSTAYRGPWEYGLPIVQRKNHSYAVTYYSPQGTDATIYPPSVDLKFLNDTPGALLIHAFSDDLDRAFFVYYGTKDERITEVFGPFIWGSVAAPKQERIVYTTDLKPGEKKKVGERHDGMKVLWYRQISRAGTGSVLEEFYSNYEARPLYYQVGTAADTSLESDRATDSALRSEPSWLPSNE